MIKESEVKTVLRGKSIPELRNEVLSLRQELFTLRMQYGNALANKSTEFKTHKFRKIRKDIALIKTIISEKGD